MGHQYMHNIHYCICIQSTFTELSLNVQVLLAELLTSHEDNLHRINRFIQLNMFSIMYDLKVLKQRRLGIIV